jgi:hypothetical protein
MADRKEYQALRYHENINGTKDKHSAYYQINKTEINEAAKQRARERHKEARRLRMITNLKIKLMKLKEIKIEAAQIFNETMEEIRETEDRIAEMEE